MKCRNFLFLLFLAPIVTLASNQKVTLQLKWRHQFQFAGYYAALHKGFYKDAGLDVAIAEYAEPVNPIKRVLNGGAEYGVGNSDLILYKQKGYQPVLLAVFFQHSPLALMTLLDSKIQRPSDLNGKKILLEPNSNEIKAWLQRAKIYQSSELIFKDHNLKRFLNKEVDAISIYTTKEPLQLRDMGIGFNIFRPLDMGIDFYGDNLFTSENEMRLHPARALAFREASIKGWKYAINNKEEIAKLIYEQYSKEFSVKELLAEADAIEALMELDIIEPGYYKEGRWGHIASTYAELGMLPNNISLEGFFYEEYLEKYPAWVKRGFISLSIGFITLLVVSMIFYRQRRAIKISEKKYRDLYEKAPIGFLLLDKKNLILEWNKAAEDIFGYKRAETLGRDVMEFLVPKSVLGELMPKISNLYSTNKEFSSINENIKKNGEVIVCEWVNTPLFDSLGKVYGVVCMVTDVTAREEFLRKTKESENKFKTLLDSAPFPIIITNYQTSEILFVNQALTIEIKEGKSSLLGQKAVNYWADIFDREVFIGELQKRGHVDSYEVKLKRKDGSVFWAQMSGTRMLCDDNDSAFISFVNIEKQKMVKEELKIRSTALEYAANGFMITDKEAVVEYVNPAFTEITGYTIDEIKGQKPTILKCDGNPTWLYKQLWETILAGKIWRGELQNKKKNGDIFYQSTSIAPVRDDYGKIIKFVSVIQDITEQKTVEQKLQQMAHFDPLTNLPNRALFFEHIDEKISHASGLKPVAVMFIDLDGFKEINDKLGHENGDTILKEVAVRLKSCIDKRGFVARMGGDEFTVLISENVDVKTLQKEAERILEELNKGYTHGIGERSVGASIGISIYPDHGKDAKTLLSKADKAMYRAKMDGKNRYFISNEYDYS